MKICHYSDGRPQRRHHNHHASSLERRTIREHVATNNDIGSVAVSRRTSAQNFRKFHNFLPIRLYLEPNVLTPNLKLIRQKTFSEF